MEPVTGLIQFKYVISSVLYSGIGLAVFTIAFVILDLATPKISIWKELVDKQNVAFAVFLGAIALGISIIIASAIHG